MLNIQSFDTSAESSATIALLVENYTDDVHRQRQEYARLAAQLLPVATKCEADSMNGGRLYSQLQTFRFCRLLNFEFVADTNLAALRQELLIYTPCFPFTDYNSLEPTLLEYKKAAESHRDNLLQDNTREVNQNICPDDLWKFWTTHYMQLPAWYCVAEEVAIVFTSSAAVERVFSLYDAFFGDNDRGCLADRREASMKLHHNKVKRKKEARASEAM